MNKFLETYNLPKLNQEKIEHLNRLITSNGIESVINKLPTSKSPEPEGLTGEFYWTFKEQLIPILLQLFQKLEEEGKLPNSFSEASNTLIPIPEKDTTKKRELQANISGEHRCKIPQQNTSKLNPSVHLKNIHHNEVGFFPLAHKAGTVFAKQSAWSITSVREGIKTWSYQ